MGKKKEEIETEKKREIVRQLRKGLEEANRIGYETAMRWTKGQHAFIVATHIDKANQQASSVGTYRCTACENEKM